MLDPGAPARFDLAEFEGQHCFLRKLAVPLLCQAGRSNDQHALCPAGQHKTADRKSRLDRLAQTDLVAQSIIHASNQQPLQITAAQFGDLYYQL